MRTGSSEIVPGDLAEARCRFQAWRNRRERGSRIPSELWALAAKLATRYGVSRTSMALGLDYYGLKKRVEGAGDQPQSGRPAFVELPSAAVTGKQCSVELDNGSGAIMRLQLSGYDAVDLTALAGSFWSAG
jgi:hypothetical protein